LALAWGRREFLSGNPITKKGFKGSRIQGGKGKN
jgi:hypothetical protein